MEAVFAGVDMLLERFAKSVAKCFNSFYGLFKFSSREEHGAA